MAKFSFESKGVKVKSAGLEVELIDVPVPASVDEAVEVLGADGVLSILRSAIVTAAQTAKRVLMVAEKDGTTSNGGGGKRQYTAV